MKDFQSRALKIENNELSILDQTLLPFEEKWIPCLTVNDLVQCIRQLKVRGAPLIGLAASAFVELQRQKQVASAELERLSAQLMETRPTAVNLRNNLQSILEGKSWEALAEEDILSCQKMASAGSALIQDGDQILTHCNTGSLATLGKGTALGCLCQAHEDGKKIHVWVDETRPLLQGGRLTAWELEKLQISHSIVADSMAATLMKNGKVSRIFVGADRICRNGDFANKIGTYSLAVLAKHHSVEFNVVAPRTTLDSNMANGQDIEIEQRPPEEIHGFVHPTQGVQWTQGPVYNPSFDVTPHELVSHWIIEDQVLSQFQIELFF